MAPREQTNRSANPLFLHGTRSIIIGGLVVGAVLGFGGNFVEPGNLQSILYGVSAVGLIVASVLLAVEHAFGGNVLAAAGFALLALGETRVLNRGDAPGGEGDFAAGVFLYAPGLAMLALSRWAPVWVRLLGAVSAVLFAVHSVAYFAGGAVDSAGPVAGAGYALLTVTIIGWVLSVLRSPASPPERTVRTDP